MFTGLIERTGKVVSASPATASAPARLWIDAGADFPAGHGDSIAINGCCLTVVAQDGHRYAFDVSRETLARTTLGMWLANQPVVIPAAGATVNLERALRVGDRLGGHLVSGHIDGIGQVIKMEREGDGWLLRVSIAKPMGRFVIGKGSICIDGVSLTVNALKDSADATVIDMMLIPTTLEITNLGQRKPGDNVNLELDMIAKFAERQTATFDWVKNSHKN